MGSLKYTSSVVCPKCGDTEIHTLSDDLWRNSYECQQCHQIIRNNSTHQGWSWIYCIYGDTPWIGVQKQRLL